MLLMLSLSNCRRKICVRFNEFGFARQEGLSTHLTSSITFYSYTKYIKCLYQFAIGNQILRHHHHLIPSHVKVWPKHATYAAFTLQNHQIVY